jgi:hypothetical protein
MAISYGRKPNEGSRDDSSLSKTVQFDIPENVRPAFETKLVKQQEYDDIEIVKWVDGKPNKRLDKIVLHPIETGHLIEFRSSKENYKSTISFKFQNISRVRIIDDIKKSFFGEKKDKLLGITLIDDHDEYEIILNVKDKESDTILKDMEVLRNTNIVNYWRSAILPYENNDGSIVGIEIFPNTPFLPENEVLLWYRIVTKGVIHQNISWIDAITNYRVFQYNFENHGANYIILTALDDTAVTNRYRVSQGQNYGYFTGYRYGSMRSGIYTSRGNSKSKSIGDVVFIFNGKPLIQFNQVSDPSGVVKLAQSARKHLLGLYKITALGQKKNDVIHVEKIYSNLCRDCNFNNPPSSKYCNQCGFKLK